MKQLIILIALFTFLISASCSKMTVNADTTITGKWQLKEQLSDPGDGSGTWRPTQQTDGYIIFNSDSTIESNVVYMTGFGRYSINGSSLILFTPDGTAKYTYQYAIKEAVLEIYPNCIERCGLRFVKK